MAAESVLILVVSALVVSCCCVSAQSANHSWVLSERSSRHGKQYKIYTTFQLNYFDAEKYCYNENMILASIDSPVDQEILIHLIEETRLPSVNLWTSGSDLAEKDRWVWGYTGRPFTYTNWQTNEPNHDVVKGEVEHCVRLEYKHNFQWNDVVCSEKNYVACEL